MLLICLEIIIKNETTLFFSGTKILKTQKRRRIVKNITKVIEHKENKVFKKI
jgi:hypothetical protein